MTVACALALAALGVQAADATARVVTFSPQGNVPAVQQVRATFSEPMLPLGKVTAPGPFDVDCALKGDAHWVDDRTWVMDLREQEFNGQACEFRLKASLRSLAGHAVAEPRVFRFQVPVLTDDVRRKVALVLPRRGADWVAENQDFLLNYTHAIAKGTPPDVRCEAPGLREAQVLRQPAAAGEPLKRLMPWMTLQDDRTEVVRCPFALAPGSTVTLRLVRPGLKPDEMTFKVRALPATTLDCTRIAPGGDCAAGATVTLRFNAAMPQALLGAIRVAGAGEPGVPAVHPGTMYSGASSTLTFPATAFQPQSEYRIVWPARALVDDAGRPMARGALPMRIKTLPPLPMAYFALPSVAVRPLQADNRVPVFVQGQGWQPGVRELVPGGGEIGGPLDGELLQWMGITAQNDGTGHYFPAQASRSRGHYEAQQPVLPVEAQALALEADGQVRLKGAGLHVLELQGFAARGGVGPIYDSVAVLLTRLAVHLKVGSENAAVWVTRMDDGSPVAGVDLRVYDCAGNTGWDGRTDTNGMATIAVKGLTGCRGYPDRGATVIARHTWPDGVRDVSLASSRWDMLLDPGAYGVRTVWGGALTQAQTVLDRSLFKPGETVSMRHVLRVEGNLGLTLPEPSGLPQEAKVAHQGSGKSWAMPLQWGDPGEGVSTFELPADAPLGQYVVSLPLDPGAGYGRQIYTASFAVEAFRLPAMLGGVKSPAAALLAGAAPVLDLALHFADGGAAQGWPVTLTAHANAGGYRRPTALNDYPMGWRMGPDKGPAEPEVPDTLLLHTQALVLDEQGHARLALPALPARARPYVLHVEMSYQDPNGEAQTLSQDFSVLPSPLSVGVRTLGSVAVAQRLQVQALVVNEAGAPQAGQPLRLAARRWLRYGSDEVEDLGEVCQGETDAHGLLTCDFTPRKPGAFQFEATATPAGGRSATAFSHVATAGSPRPAQPLFLNADKPLYRVGETAVLSVVSPFPRARAWLALERQGILETRLVTLDGARTQLRLPVRREWAGNVAVSLLALEVGGRAQPVAAAAAGITTLVVSTQAHALRVTVTPERTRYQPRERAGVRIHVAAPDGRPLPAARRLSFVAVDEALLSLKDNATWQLLAAMHRPRQHGVQTTSVLTMNPEVDKAQWRDAAQAALFQRLAEAARRARDAARGIASPVAAPAPMAQKIAADDSQQLERIEVTGSAIASGAADPSPTRTLLDALLIWQADVPLDDNGDAVVSFPIKDALSRFRLVAVASAGVEDFGTGSAYLDVVKDLQLTAGLPPQVRDGDRFAALVTVRNTSSAAITLDAAAKLAGQPALPTRTLRLAAGESRQLSWDVRVPLGAKALDWTFSAKEQGHSNRQDVLQVAQQVLPAVPVTVQAATLAQVNGTFDVPTFGFDSAEASGARVNVQLLPTLAGNLGGVRDWLALYPYRCLEQTASRAVGMHDRAAWDNAMATLPQYLDDDGLANYFPRMPSQPWPGSDTLTAYLLDIAHAAGWPVPEAERNRMLAALEGFVAGRVQRTFWAPRKDDLARKIAAMATLARYERLKPAQLAGVRVDPDEWTTAMLIDWLTLQRKLGGNPAAQEEAQNALRARLTYQGRRMGFSTETRDYWWWLMSHGDVDAARLMLAVADLPDWKADLPRLLTGLLSRQNHGAWATTTANAWGTLAVDAFARVMEPVPVAGTTRITLGTQQQTVNWAQAKQVPFDGKLEKPTDALHIQHQGAGAPWASVEVRAAVPLKEPRNAGYSISRSITPVQQRVPGQWHVGDTLRVRLAVRAQADMSWVVVDDPVPAGASLLGNGLGRDSAAAQSGEQRAGWVWPLYQARDYTSFKSFYRYVPRGEFSLEYTMRLNNPGQFTLPPTRVEAMYAPEVFGEAPNAGFGVEP